MSSSLGNVPVGPAAEPVTPRTENHSSRDRAIGLHVGFILLAGLLARIPFYLAFRPVWSGDSPGYSLVYYLWRHHIFYLGERTPVYPLFLGVAQWLAGGPPEPFLSQRTAYAATLLQSALDVLAAVLFYFTLRSLRIRGSIAFGASLFLATIPAMCFHEVNILNMSLAFFCLVLVISLFVPTVQRLRTGKDISIAARATGAALAITVLNRPDLLIFSVLLLLITACLPLKPRLPGSASIFSARPLGAATWMTLPLACALLVWMLLMYAGIGEFRITTLNGWNRTRTVYNMFDRVDAEDAAIGEIMARTYQRKAAHAASANLREIVWQAHDELLLNYPRYPITDPTRDPSPLHLQIARVALAHNVLGLVEIPCELSPRPYCWQFMRLKINTGDYLGRVSWKLARKYPRDWLHNVVANFFEESFTFRYSEAKPTVAGYEAHSADGSPFVRNSSIAALTTAAANAQSPLLTLMYVVTLGYCIFFFFPAIFSREQDDHWLPDVTVAALAVASVGTIVGTCVLAGLNRVYSLPHLVVFTICTAYALENHSRIVSVFRTARSLRTPVSANVWE